MARQPIATDPTSSLFLSDPMRHAFEKIDANFTELYSGGSGATLGANTFTDVQTLRFSSPTIDMYATTGTAEEHWWRMSVSSNGDVWRLQTISDDGLTAVDYMTLARFHNSPINMSIFAQLDTNDLLSINANTSFGSQVSPTLAAGDNNDLNPNGSIGSRTWFRMTPDAGGSTITGLNSVTARELKLFTNIHATVDIVLSHNDAASQAANRIMCPDNVDFTLSPQSSVWIIRDVSSSVWRVIQNA